MQFIRNFLKQIGNQEITEEDPKLSQLNEILKEASSTTTSKQLFEHVNDDYWFWLHTEGYRQNSQLRTILPSLPDEAIQLRFTGASGDETLRRAFQAYTLFNQYVHTKLKTETGLSTILDFGCGWGRIIRFFLKDVEPANLWGIDCFPEAIQLCQETNKWANFEVTDPMPPTSFPDNKFDLIYCYSVFSHLSEEAHDRWLIEFKRILKPGGLLIATTHPRGFILVCAEIRKNNDKTNWKGGAARAFLDTEQALADYDSGKYLHDPVGGGDVLATSFYGETCISKAYALNHWGRYYEFIDYIDDPKKCIQNGIIVRK